jgi:hypothetical protein
MLTKVKEFVYLLLFLKSLILLIMIRVAYHYIIKIIVIKVLFKLRLCSSSNKLYDNKIFTIKMMLLKLFD